MGLTSSTGFWRGRAVLVTGGNGFIGGNLARALVNAGASVIVLVRDLRPNGGVRLFGLEHDAVIVLGSVTDEAVVDRALRQYRVQHCFHLAAQALVGAARSSPSETFDSNVRGTWTVLEACRRADVETIVVASSDKAYGPSTDLPYRESHPLLARSTYDASKACADVIASTFHHTYGLPVAITRMANVYGAGDLNVSRLIPDVVLAALSGRPPVLRSNGQHVRDFLYVDDAVAGYLTLGEQASSGGIAGEAFNFGTGTPQRVLDVVRRVLELAERPDLVPIIEDRLAPGEELEAQYASSEKAERLLGWRPRIDLDEGLARTIAWYRHYYESTGQATTPVVSDLTAAGRAMRP